MRTWNPAVFLVKRCIGPDRFNIPVFWDLMIIIRCISVSKCVFFFGGGWGVRKETFLGLISSNIYIIYKVNYVNCFEQEKTCKEVKSQFCDAHVPVFWTDMPSGSIRMAAWFHVPAWFSLNEGSLYLCYPLINFNPKATSQWSPRRSAISKYDTQYPPWN